MAEAMRAGADVVGGMPHWEARLDAARAHIEFCLDLAVRHDADVDMHVDETDDPASRTLRAAGRGGRAARLGRAHDRRATCARWPRWEDAYAAAVIARAAAAGVKVVTNPPTNLMLQGRGGL